MNTRPDTTALGPTASDAGPTAAPDLLDADHTREPELLEAVRAYAVRILNGLDDRPAAQTPAKHRPVPLPERGIGLKGAMEAFARRWEPGFSGSAGPRYLGFVTGGVTPAALAGDWLTSVLDQNPNSGLDSRAPDLEREAVAWLRELFGLPAEHEGAFVSGATMSNLVGLAIAREWVGERRGVSVAEEGVAALGPVPVLSGSPHSSIGKALSVLGLGRSAVRHVGVLPDREAVDVNRLDEELDRLDGAPAIVVANAGTVNTVDFDDLRAIAALRERHRFWLHVDAAFGAFAALSPGHAHLVAGLAEADSVCVDLHKWLNVPYDSAVQFTRRRDLQTRVFQNSAAYLGPLGPDPDFVHLTPENSRRLRALPAWFTLAAYGREGHAGIVRRDADLAAAFGLRIVMMPAYRLLAPVRLNVVCFTLADSPSAERVAEVVRAVTDSGEAFLTPTVYAGMPALRAAFSNWRTTEADVDRVAKALEAAVPPRP
ncbi:glutamate/tyrosine decarboxylase-like PLP-dependent enzyme [Streptosporangium becharense]|uniref:Glutamate/tyrosine decarboxylase-like PLP-dependent enzyme n=1 Tax=Streptosporangium becharense TaxID=1816182 RepID=A0A7W9MIJ0_9ACTN|nr:pyridoxal-dependent decarboxylase [Streptosporangium becharense]MBB2913284.1 glutamate/tyrosine decarboxylase-like PLP-dependent enzyme [Streptosporangium becharense]MBB5822267.1 glutamate/tyrosine decarboxylase-like PLP-dependent enzyme [Streptosporangium becharense]